MKLTYSYRALTDWGDVLRGQSFIDILESAGLKVEGVDGKEPIKKEFKAGALSEHWAGRGLPGQHSTCYFLFKGQGKCKFSGMVTWHRDLPEESTYFNSLNVWLSIGKSRPDPVWFLDLGDRLFGWSQAYYGFISLDTLYDPLHRPAAKRLFIPKLFWANYFGQDYLSCSDFRLPVPAADLPTGKRMVLGSSFDDPCLADETYLSSVAEEIGLGWFGEGNADEYRIPDLDFALLWRSGRSL